MKEKIHAIAPWLFSLAGIIYDIAFFLNHGRAMLDSDMAAEMVLADLMNQEHALITKNWIYSTEIKAAGMQWFYCIGLWLSQDNWLVARTIGAAMALVLYLLSWLYLAHALELKNGGKWIIAILSWPFGFWYFFDVIWGAYYIPHSMFIVLSFGLMLTLAKDLKKYFAWVLLALFSVLAGLNGMRMLVLFYFPVVFASLCILYMSFRKESKSGFFNKNDLKHKFALAAFAGMFFNLIGYGINLVFFVNKYHFVNQEGMVWGKGSGSWLETFKWYFDSFGLTDFATKKFFSLSGIGAGCGLALGILVFISVIRLIVNYKKLSELCQIYVASLLGIFFVVGMVFTYVWGEEQYWLPIVQFGVGALIIEIKTDPILKVFERVALHYAVVLFAIISAIGIVKANISQPLRANIDFEPVISFLEESGYTQGVASFWRSQVVTELTNGDIEMWTMNDEFDSTFLWLQHNSHRDIPTGDFFAIYTVDDEDAIKTFSETFDLEGKKVYGDDRYQVYLYEN
ncbi:hypothetical protein [Pseudobutyrivibrio ruminis]|uniref:hypothetical protein n=1 Tax=Pseudobutyrivibrio ruminis TaxID=46206 RepID=UPI00051C72FE|nr:hypothetical protein [Pseudobutyrivibrio ruminis]